jgi:O-antigen ligase
LGLELFGLRIQSIASPDIEQSSLSRKILLPKIIEKIKKNPLLGNGLGDTVTIFSPVVKKQITTSQFDWGYLEIIDELGLVGLVGWILLITLLIYQIRLYRDNQSNSDSTALYSSLGSLLVVNLTSPALFHVFGIILITIFYLETTKHPTSAIHAS